MLPDNQALCDHKRSPSLPRPLLGGSREPRLGLVEEVEGDVPGALRRLEVARQCAARTTDCYVWIEAYALEALAGVAIRAQSRRAVEWVEDLRSLAARTGMREMAAQAYL
jgi:hypothetical protein